MWCILALFVGLVGVSGCEDPPTSVDPLLAAAPAGVEVAALWRPAGLAVDDAGSIYVFEQASGRLRVIDPQGNVSTLASIRPNLGDTATLPIRRIGPDMGLEVELLDDGAVVIAGAQHPLVLLAPNAASGEPLGRLEGGVAPSAGVALADVDMRGMRGFALREGTQRFVFAIGEQLWEARAADGLTGADALRQALLRPIAGNGRRGVGTSGLDALSLPLELGDWVGIAANSEELIFIEGPRLRYLHQGHVMTLTGEGTLRGKGPFPLEDFSSSFLGFSHADWHDGTFYVLDDRVVRGITIDAVDAAAGTARGEVWSATPGATELNDFVVSSDILLSWGFGGTVLSFPRFGADSVPEDLTFASVFGPLDASARYRLLDAQGASDPEHAPYRLDGLLLPQEIAPLFGGDIILVNEPLSRLILAIDRTLSPPVVSEFWASSQKRGWGYGPMTSDGASRVSWIDRTLLVLFDLRVFQRYADQGENCPPTDPCIVGLNIFRSPNLSGIPGPGREIAFSAPFTITAGHTQLMLFSAQTAELFTVQLANGWVEMETGPRFGSTSIYASPAPRVFALDLRGASAADMGDDEIRLVVLPDPAQAGDLLAVGHPRYACDELGCSDAPYECSTTQDCGGQLRCVQGACVFPFGGRDVGLGDYVSIGGGGAQDIVDGAAARDVLLAHIDSSSFVVRGGHPSALVAATGAHDDRHLFTITEDGHLDVLQSGCGALPATFEWIATWPPRVWPPEALLGREATGVLSGCRLEQADALWIGGRELTAESWTPLEDLTTDVPPAVSSEHHGLVRYQRYRGLSTLGLDIISHDPEHSETRRIDLTMPLDEVVTSMAVAKHSQQVFLAVLGAHGPELRVTELSTAGASGARTTATSRAPRWDLLAGGGAGLLESSNLAMAALGADPAALAIGPDGDVYVAVRDTAALWRLRLGEDGMLSTDDVAELVWRGLPVFAPGRGPYALAVAPDGAIYVASGGAVYEVRDGAAVRVAGGGVAPLLEGHDPNGSALGEVWGLTVVDDALYVHSEVALFALHDARAYVVFRAGQAASDGFPRGWATQLMFAGSLARGRKGELLLADPVHSDVLSIKPHFP